MPSKLPHPCFSEAALFSTTKQSIQVQRISAGAASHQPRPALGSMLKMFVKSAAKHTPVGMPPTTWQVL